MLTAQQAPRSAAGAPRRRSTPGRPPPWEKAVAFAYAHLGKPYPWGATGPGSYDCSGLVQATWARPGRYGGPVILSVLGALGKKEKLRRILPVFGGWWVGWTSATIARYVYPPPKSAGMRDRGTS
jgi:hypothetical protein